MRGKDLLRIGLATLIAYGCASEKSPQHIFDSQKRMELVWEFDVIGSPYSDHGVNVASCDATMVKQDENLTHGFAMTAEHCLSITAMTDQINNSLLNQGGGSIFNMHLTQVIIDGISIDSNNFGIGLYSDSTLDGGTRTDGVGMLALPKVGGIFDNALAKSDLNFDKVPVGTNVSLECTPETENGPVKIRTFGVVDQVTDKVIALKTNKGGKGCSGAGMAINGQVGAIWLSNYSETGDTIGYKLSALGESGFDQIADMAMQDEASR